MNLITDKTIDYSSAKYWCIFSNPKLVKTIQSLSPTNKKSGKKELDESFLSILGYAGYLFTASSLARFFAPYVKNMWRKCFQGKKNKLAEVQFTADEASYTATFDLDTMKWKLYSTLSISEQESIQFFETKFFAKFNEQCKEYIAPILASKDSLIKQIQSNKDVAKSDEGKFLLKLLANAKHVASNMFDPHYIT